VKNNRPIAVIGRSLACKWLVEDLGVRGAEVAVLMGITPSAVTQNVARGRRIEAGKGFALAVGAKDI